MAETNETGAGNAVAAAGDNPKHPWPVVDEQYWLDRAKQMLDNPEERWTTTIKTLNKYILYIYGLYTAGVVAAGIIDKLQVSGGMLFVLSLPYLFLFGAYAASHWSAMPLARYGKNGEGFDPRSPDEIRDAVNDINRKRLFTIQLSMSLAAVGAMLTGFGLMYAFTRKPPEPEKPETKKQEIVRDSLNFDAAYHKRGNAAYLNVSGYFVKDTDLEVELVSEFPPKGKRKADSTALTVYHLHTPDSGMLVASLPLPADSAAKGYKLTLSRVLDKKDNTRLMVHKQINKPAAGKAEVKSSDKEKKEDKKEGR